MMDDWNNVFVEDKLTVLLGGAIWEERHEGGESPRTHRRPHPLRALLASSFSFVRLAPSLLASLAWDPGWPMGWPGTEAGAAGALVATNILRFASAAFFFSECSFLLSAGLCALRYL